MIDAQRGASRRVGEVTGSENCGKRTHSIRARALDVREALTSEIVRLERDLEPEDVAVVTG